MSKKCYLFNNTRAAKGKMSIQYRFISTRKLETFLRIMSLVWKYIWNYFTQNIEIQTKNCVLCHTSVRITKLSLDSMKMTYSKALICSRITF